MRFATFQGYNIAGGIAWSTLFIWGGFLFGNIPVVKNNFGLVTLGIVAVSLLPLAWTLVSERNAAPS
jgi:membrane-associated protein